MKLIEIQNILEEWSPLENSEDFDNVGLIIGNPNSEVNGALITIDVTEKVIDEAINMGYNLIITFHPLMYKGSNKLNSEEYVDICIEKALKNNLNVYCIHTNLDNHSCKQQTQNVQSGKPRDTTCVFFVAAGTICLLRLKDRRKWMTS